MNFKELFEGVEPSMPGAPRGIQIMTPQQFVAKSGDMPGEKEVDEGKWNPITGGDHPTDWTGGELESGPSIEKFQAMLDYYGNDINVTRALDDLYRNAQSGSYYDSVVRQDRYLATIEDRFGKTYKRYFPSKREAHAFAKGYNHVVINIEKIDTQEDTSDLITLPVMLGIKDHKKKWMLQFPSEAYAQKWEFKHKNVAKILWDETHPLHRPEPEAVAESLDRIRKLSGLDEATKLPASSREFGGDEFQDYMKRIVGTPDIDKKTGEVKKDKKGIEKYVSGKTKTDKYKMPYIHRSSVIEYLGPDGKTYDEDKIKQSLAQRPKALLKQNEKMKHSNGELEQFFNVGFAALTGIALDEDTNKLIIVNTCPGAGSCKVDCFAMKGGKVQFKAAWQSDGRILTYLLNDPDGFFNQLSAEISKEEALGKKGGYTVTIRWHDAGDFFSPEYLDMALKMAAKHPNTRFYAYTKMAGAALAQKPDNFIINWSEGAHTSQEKQVKAQDKDLDTTKNSRIVPDEIFQDLLVKDQKGNLVKGQAGQWQVQPDKLPELKQRLAKQYGLSANSILDYNEYMAKRKSIPAGMKYNVIVAPGEGDISANDPNIISTLLLKH